jgi:hypothetical protein
MATLKNDLIGNAGVHFVAFKLALRGMIVLPTIRNTAGIDLLVYEPGTGAQATLQVKTSQNKVSFWPVGNHEKLVTGPQIFYIFLRYIQRSTTFQVYLETSSRVAARVKANADDYAARGRKPFSFWDLPATPQEQQQLEQAWNCWTP